MTKCISIKQPFASLIVEGVKDIENRTWKLPEKYKGQRVLIHASADKSLDLSILTRQQYEFACEKLDPIPTMPVEKYLRGAIIGSIEIVDCVINHESIWAEKTEGVLVGHAFYTKEETKTIYNWVLANPIKFPKPIPVKGKLGFWEFEPDDRYMECKNTNGYAHQGCGEKIGCIQQCDECDYYGFVYDFELTPQQQ
jgi:hypothetical protein